MQNCHLVNPTAASTQNPGGSSTKNLDLTIDLANNPKSMQNSTVLGLEPNPLKSHEQRKELAEKQILYKWPTWSIIANPPAAQIPYSPRLFCKIHKQLASVNPPDNIYSAPPCRVVGNRRFNLPQIKGYLIHSSRQVGKGLSVVRRIDNSTATWKAGKWTPVAGKGGKTVGMRFKLTLIFAQKEGGEKPPKALWTAEEFVSVKNKAGNSAVVVLTCQDEEWNRSEAIVEHAEDALAFRVQKLVEEKHKKPTESTETNIYNMEESVVTLSAILGLRIEEFEQVRLRMSEVQDSLCGFLGVNSEAPDVGLCGGTVVGLNHGLGGTGVGLNLGLDAGAGLNLGLDAGAGVLGRGLGFGVGSGFDLGLGAGVRDSDLGLGGTVGLNHGLGGTGAGLNLGLDAGAGVLGCGLAFGLGSGFDLGLGAGVRDSDLGLGLGACAGSNLGLGIGEGSDVGLGIDLRLRVGSGVYEIENDVTLGIGEGSDHRLGIGSEIEKDVALGLGVSDLGTDVGSDMLASAFKEPVLEECSNYYAGKLAKRRAEKKISQKLSKKTPPKNKK